MNIPQYAWLQILPSKPLKMFLPSHSFSSKKQNPSIQQITIGSHNQIKKVITSYTKDRVVLPYTYPIRLIKKGNRYKAGPFVGILTTMGKQGFKGNRKNFIDIIQMGKKTGVFVFVFEAETVDLYTKTVRAYIYNSTNKNWVTVTLPLPDVIYNRIPTRRDEGKPAVQEVLRFFHKDKVAFFNPKFFNKWTLYEWLKERNEFTKILPETTKLRQQDLQRYLQQYPMLYIKPANGKAGVGFMRIEKKDKNYILIYQNHQSTSHQLFKNFHSLWNKTNALAKNKEYIIQQGIFLNTFKNQPYDLRALIQKNGKNQWNVTGIGARVAGNRSITTHVPQGGMIQSVDHVFKETFNDEVLSKEWKEKTSELVIKVAEHIESKMGDTLGEMSMDLGIDKDGNLWFFEANAKPMEFDEPTIREASLLRLIQYFRYLSGFAPKERKHEDTKSNERNK